MKKYLSLFILVCFGVALVATPASATILFAGGEDLDFTSTGGPLAVTTNNTYFNSTYAREAVYNSIDGNDNYIKTPYFTSSSNFWTHFDWVGAYSGQCCSQDVFNAGWDWFVFADSGGVARITVRPVSTTNGATTITISKINAVGTVTTLVTSSVSVFGNPLNTIDVYINYSSTGTITLYQNGAQIVTYSGDVTTDGNTSLAQLWLGYAGAPDNPYDYYSQVIISTTDTRSQHVATITPSANGNTMAWTGVVGSINTTSYNDANTISSATTGQLAEFTFTALPAGSYSIVAVVQSARAAATVGGIQNLQFDARTGGTSYQSANQALAPGMKNYQYVWTTNPNTSAAWTTSDLSAAGLNFGLESQT